jgi:hypothetical protein
MKREKQIKKAIEAIEKACADLSIDSIVRRELIGMAQRLEFLAEYVKKG